MRRRPRNRIAARRVLRRRGRIAAHLERIARKALHGRGAFGCRAVGRGGEREGVLAAPLVVEPLRAGIRHGRGLGPEVFTHEGLPGGVFLSVERGFVIHRPDMPRPDAVARSVEQSDKGVTTLGARAEQDAAVRICYLLHDGTAGRAGLPENLRRDTRESLRRDARRRAAVAHDRGVERVPRPVFGRSIAVGRAPAVERRGRRQTAHIDLGTHLLRTEKIHFFSGELLRTAAVGIPAVEGISGVGHDLQAALFEAEQRGPRTLALGFRAAIERVCSPHGDALRGMDVEEVGEVVCEIIILRESVLVGQPHAVVQTAVPDGENLRGIAYGEAAATAHTKAA